MIDIHSSSFPIWLSGAYTGASIALVFAAAACALWKWVISPYLFDMRRVFGTGTHKSSKT